MALALIVAVLIGTGVFMILRRGVMRIVVGFILISHGVNVLLVMAGDPSRRRPAIGQTLDTLTDVDPLPQAFVLTAVVIAFAVTMFMLTLAVIGDGDDDTDIPLKGSGHETADLLPPDHPAYRKYAPQDWHAYVDRADDSPDDPPDGSPDDGTNCDDNSNDDNSNDERQGSR